MTGFGKVCQIKHSCREVKVQLLFSQKDAIWGVELRKINVLQMEEGF